MNMNIGGMMVKLENRSTWRKPSRDFALQLLRVKNDELWTCL